MMKFNILFFFSLIILTLNCSSRQNNKLDAIKFSTEKINEGKIDLIFTNNSNRRLLIPNEIHNDALIITDFQKVIKDGSNYAEVGHKIVNFDCFGPHEKCFPKDENLNSKSQKKYTFELFNPNNLDINKTYRIKVLMENFISKEPNFIKSDWIYFIRK